METVKIAGWEVDKEILKAMVKCARAKLLQGFRKAFFVYVDKENQKIEYLGRIHIHGADSHVYLPENVHCIRMPSNQYFYSYQDAEKDMEEWINFFLA